MKFAITSTFFIITMLFIVSFMSIDACMDAGGVWSNWGLNCQGASESFIPQYKRKVPVFWFFVLVLSGGVALIVNKIVPAAKP